MNPVDEDNQPLLEEMQALRARVAELESAEANHKHLEETLRRQSHDLGKRDSPDTKGGSFRVVGFVIATMLVMGIGMIAFQAIKDWLLPDASLRESHTITNVFSALVAGAIAFVVLRRSRKQDAVLIRTLTEQRKWTEELLRESDEYLGSLLRYGSVPVVVWDTEFRIIRFNHAFERLTGNRTKDVLSSPFELLFPDEQRDEAMSRIRQTVNGDRLEAIEIPILGMGGEVRSVLWNSAPIRAPDGKTIIATIAQGVDITARKREEMERGKLQEQLYQAQKMEAVGQLASGVAHDFNNLTTVIRGHCDQLRKATSDDHKASESLDIIDETVEQASSMTRSLLSFTRKLPTERCVLDLRTTVDTAARMLRRMLPDSIELRMDRVCDESIHVMGDRVQLQQVVLNLAINARDAMPNGGVLCISLFPCAATDTPGSQACFARIEVSDTGTGMSPDIRDRIFEPFFTTKTREQGTGLGLSITYGIIKDHGGRIDVQSEVDRGTTFSLILPCADPDSVQGSATPAMPERRGMGELILLAEDHRYVRNIMTSALLSLGYEVISAESGPALLDHYEQHRPETRLVVLDVDLPGRSGLDCLRTIREKTASLPIILVTGNIDPDIESQVDAGAVLLHKPFQVAELARLVGHMLADPSQEDESS